MNFARSNACEQLQFIAEQIKQWETPVNNRRYTDLTMLLAATVFLHSAFAYVHLHTSKLLRSPHPRNVKKLIRTFSLHSLHINGGIEYLKAKIHLLQENEFVVNIHVEEIYINSKLNFKGDSIFGASEDNPLQVVKRAQVCMISGVFSKFKDVVTIVPVSNTNGN